MKKVSYMIFVPLLIFACGNSNAEQTEEVVEKKISTPEQVEVVTKEQIATEELEENMLIEEAPQEETSVIEVPVETPLEKEESTQVEQVLEEIVEEAKVEIVLPVQPNHEVWNGLTKQYVSTSGKVNYKGMRTNLSKIATYLKQLATTPPKSDWNKNEKLAYWINLYNASTVYLIASNYPVKSITDINGGKPWDKKFVKSGDKVYTLNQIENDIVRPRFKDPRIHAALNCAAVSCPKLLNEAYVGNQLSAQLDKQTKAWINDTGKNKLLADKVEISKIFEWYAIDFKVAGGTVGFINKYTTAKIASSAKVSFLEYNWALNE